MELQWHKNSAAFPRRAGRSHRGGAAGGAALAAPAQLPRP